MKHDPYLANDLVVQSLLATVRKLADRVDKLEAEVTTLKRKKPRRKGRSARISSTTPEISAIVGPIVERAARINGTTVAEVYGDTGNKRARLARAEACYECQRAGLSTPVIGRAIGSRDHTSVLYLIGRHKSRMGIA